MAMRSALTSLPARLRSPAPAAASGGMRLMSDGKGRVLSEEERAKESVYIQKMERERQEKLKKKLEQEKAEADKAKPDKKPEGSN
uniref:ATPase inhibitor n=1 Tax=Leersia perrieri TaxID=77586 RepID=A0A0D9XAV5_9ORYZ